MVILQGKREKSKEQIVPTLEPWLQKKEPSSKSATFQSFERESILELGISQTTPNPGPVHRSTEAQFSFINNCHKNIAGNENQINSADELPTH